MKPVLFRVARGRALLGAAVLIPSLAIAQNWLGLPPTAGRTPTHNATGLSLDLKAGKRYTFVCAANDGSGASVYGTNTYTADSAICPAAIHAGVLKPDRAGAVTIVIGSGAKSFAGTTRNGITSRSTGPSPHSYAFATEGAPGTVTWQTLWSQVPVDFNDPVAVECPPGGSTSRAVWGTDVYTRDSSLCVAAVHAGVISAGKGGIINVQRAPGQKQYAASERFGVVSQQYGSLSDAFAVMAASRSAGGAPAPPPTPPPPTVGPWTIQLAGFTAAGAPGPRTIMLAAVNAQGAVAPRSFQLAGWSASGP